MWQISSLFVRNGKGAKMSSIYDQLGDACKQFGKRVGMAIKEANDLMATNGRREREMSKYVIELDEDVKILQSISVTQHGNAYTNTKWVANLEELNSDYINEHFSDLQDTAYQRGLEDAWEAARKIVVDTDNGGIALGTLGEIFGTQAYSCIMRDNTAQEAIAKLKAYEDKQKDSIEVGDEVIDRDGDITIVTNIHERLFDGLCNDGSTMGDLFLEDVRKTGRHFDHIDKLLEAMRK
jgi:hypothetical protein